MDFISNLIKRPKSLVANESATGTVEQNISSPTSIQNNNKTPDSKALQEQQLKDENFQLPNKQQEQHQHETSKNEIKVKLSDIIPEIRNKNCQELDIQQEQADTSINHCNEKPNDHETELKNENSQISNTQQEQQQDTSNKQCNDKPNDQKVELKDQIPLVETSVPVEHFKRNLNEEHPQEKVQVREQQIELPITEDNENCLNTTRSLSLSSSLNGNLTDFIGVPDDYIGQFEDILPPQPPLLSGGEFLLSPMDNENGLTSQTPSPSPISAAMTASQTLDELLSEITDNFTLAGINDEVLAIASPHSNAELSPLSAKAALNNSKPLTPSSTTTPSTSSSPMYTPRTPTTGSSSNDNTVVAPIVSPGVFEENSTLHKFPNDPELETGLFEDQHQLAVKELQNTSGVVNKASNKFAGLAEYDESKIPDLPGDLNPNIEEQYNVTFEDCFIPTLTAEQVTKNELPLEKTHLLLPNQEKTIDSTANETFSDCCSDAKDPLSVTNVEQTSICDTSTENDGYESALQDGLADMTIEIGSNQTQILSELVANHTETTEHIKLSSTVSMDYEEEPMDIDMNATIEIINKSAENIQNVERVLQHAENVLQHLDEEKENIENVNRIEKINENVLEEKIIGSLAKQSESSKMTFVINATNCPVTAAPSTPHLEIEQSIHDVSLNKSVELPVSGGVKSLSSECVVTTVNNESEKQMEIEPSLSPVDVNEVLNVTKTKKESLPDMNPSSLSSSFSSRSPARKTSVTNKLSTSNVSLNSSLPTSPSFPIKQNQDTLTFPKSPKINLGNPNKTKFLEKSDYVEKMEQQLKSNQKVLEKDNVNATFLETQSVLQNDRRRTFAVEEKNPIENTRRTFSVINDGDESTTLGMGFPAKTKKDTVRQTFCINDVSDASPDKAEKSVSENKTATRRTFNVSPEEVQTEVVNTSLEPMEIDDELNQTNTLQAQLQNSYTVQNMHATEEKNQSAALNNTDNIEPASDMQNIATTVDEQKQRSESPSDASSLTFIENRSDSSPLPAIQNRSDSPPLSALQRASQNKQNSPPLPTAMPNKSYSPPLSTIQQSLDSTVCISTKEISSDPPLLPNQETISPSLDDTNQKSMMTKQQSIEKSLNIKQEQLSPENMSANSTTSFTSAHSHPFAHIQKRPSIHRAGSGEILSAKEQSNTKIKDEKDELVEKFTPSPIEETFTTVSPTSRTFTNTSGFSSFGQNTTASPTDDSKADEGDYDDEFQGNNNLILNPSDFDYLLTKGNNNAPVDRSSLLLKFDPLLGVAVPSNYQGQQQLQQQKPLHLQIPTNTLNTNQNLSPTFEEDDEYNASINRSLVVENTNGSSNRNSDKVKSSLLCGLGRGVAAGSAYSQTTSAKSLKDRSPKVKQQSQLQYQNPQNKSELPQPVNKKNATMSVDVIKDISLDNNDCNKTFEHSNSTEPDDKHMNYKMDELEKKIKNEVLKTEDIEKKLKDAEQREEALIKRITEKDKTVAKMNGVIEAYEKAIAELIAEKEQLIQSYEKQLAEVKADRDSNYHHLTSLETTFSDLHVKYEKSKEMTCQLQGNEESLITENRKNAENLRLQEQRYDKMKNHAMQQLEIANKKLECLTREHTMEITKLKALLKKEEIARSSMSEQLAQKTKENSELVKICDELIQGQGS